MSRVAAVVEEGLHRLLATGDHRRYCIDRYWTLLADSGRFLGFRPKMGFQRPSYSDVTGRVVWYLD